MEKRKKQPSRWMSIYFPDPDLKVKLTLLAKHRGTTPSALARRLIEGEVGRAV